MNFEFKCPQCGNAVAVDESYCGQVVECPHCAKGIVVPKNKANGELQMSESKIVLIQCPHCGTKYEVSQQEMYHHVSCEICGKNFVAGATSRKQNVGATQTRSTTQTGSQRSAVSRPNQMSHSRPFIAIGNATPEPCTRKPKLAIWIAAGAACMVIMLSTAFVLGRYSGKSDSPAKKFVMARGEDNGKSHESNASTTVNDGVKTVPNVTNEKLPDETSLRNDVRGISKENISSSGQGLNIDDINDISELKRYAVQGVAEAQLRLGLYYANGEGTEVNHLEAVRWFRKAAEQNNAGAQYCLGLCYYAGNGVEKDFDEAVKWYRKAVAQGYTLAQCELGSCYVAGLGVEKDLTEGLRWYRKAAEQGMGKAQYLLGLCLANGRGAKRDDKEAFKWYCKAAEQGALDAQGQFELGRAYGEGKGVEKNVHKAVEWYRKAAEQGHARAQEVLGIHYANGKGVEKDAKEAVRWYRKAAEQGHAGAQVLLGQCYDDGKGIATNHIEAVKWYLKAAEQGDAYGQYYLGESYYLGVGVDQDEKEAIKWYRKAAEQGLSEAQHDLGTCYLNGEGVEEDEDVAIIWFRKAAEQGHAAALYDLGKCYYDGLGVDEDAVEALRLFRLAADKGHEEAQRKVQYAIAHTKPDAELLELWNVFRSENKGDLGYLISMFCIQEGVWDRHHAKDVIRNSLRRGRNLDAMTKEERKEYMKGSEFAKKNGRLQGKGDDVNGTNEIEVTRQHRNVIVQGNTGTKTMKTSASSSVSGNPLRRFRFGESGTCMHNSMRLSGFYGFEKISLGYTSRKRLFSICLTACESSDSMVRALMEECDVFYSGIRWKEDRNYKGELFAVGRRRDSQGRVELLVSIIPQPSNDEERIQANIINYDVKRIDDGDE